jgi:hypothetical protein
MTVLDTITNENPKVIYKALGKIIAVANQGSFISNDRCAGIHQTLFNKAICKMHLFCFWSA